MVNLDKIKEKAKNGEYEIGILLLIFLFALALVVGCLLLKWVIELYLWKTIIMAVFASAPALSFWQIAGIDILCGCLFGTRVYNNTKGKKE